MSGTNASSTGIEFTPPGGFIRTLLVLTLVLSCYAPFAILLYYVHRQNPVLRYRNPGEMVLTALAAFANGVARCVGPLVGSSISCSSRLVSFAVPMQVTLLGYVLAELHVVLTFHLTELMVAHASNRVVNRKRMQRIQGYLRSRFHTFGRLVLHVAWISPLIVELSSHDLRAYTGNNCPTPILSWVISWSMASFALMIAASVALSFRLSKVVDNFGLRRSFQVSGRTFSCLLLVYFPVLMFLFDSDAVVKYRLDIFINVVIDHALIWIHIVHPLRMVLKAERRDSKMLRGTAGVLNAYLDTPDGFAAFSAFAKSEFMVECVLGWRAIVDFRAEVPGHLAAVEIYNQFLAPTAPFPLNNALKGTMLKRYAIAFEKNNKSSVSPDDGPRGTEFFDVLLDAIVEKILHETLPRFLLHPLGQGWFKFLLIHSTQDALDKVLDATTDVSGSQRSTSMPSIKNASIKASTGRLLPIETEDLVTGEIEDDHPSSSHPKGALYRAVWQPPP